MGLTANSAVCIMDAKDLPAPSGISGVSDACQPFSHGRLPAREVRIVWPEWLAVASRAFQISSSPTTTRKHFRQRDCGTGALRPAKHWLRASPTENPTIEARSCFGRRLGNWMAKVGSLTGGCGFSWESLLTMLASGKLSWLPGCPFPAGFASHRRRDSASASTQTNGAGGGPEVEVSTL